jgi:uncharacterized protein DUF3558
MRVRLGAAAMLVLFVLTGCSHSTTNNDNPSAGSTTQPPEPSPGAASPAPAPNGGPAINVPDPCSLITKQDVAKVIGETDSSAVAPGGQPGQRSCGYANSASGKLVTVAVFPTDQAGFDKLRTAAGTVTNVPGVGDSAFTLASAMYARKGSLAVSVYVAGVTPDSAVPTVLSSLMTTALGRM